MSNESLQIICDTIAKEIYYLHKKIIDKKNEFHNEETTGAILGSFGAEHLEKAKKISFEIIELESEFGFLLGKLTKFKFKPWEENDEKTN